MPPDVRMAPGAGRHRGSSGQHQSAEPTAPAPAPQAAMDGLAAKINAEHAEARRHLGAGLRHALAAGQLLIEAKAKIGHGGWLPWLKVNCPDISERTCQAYMRVAKYLPRLGEKRNAVADLTLRDALSQMAAHASKIAVLPSPAAAAALRQAEAEPLRTAVSCAVNHEQAVEDQRRRRQEQSECQTVFVPRTLPPPTPEQIEQERLYLAAGTLISTTLVIVLDREPATTQKSVLDALNDVYYAIENMSSEDWTSRAWQKRAVEAALPQRSSPKAIGPIDRCTMSVRATVLDIMREMQPGELADLFLALRDELDDLEKIAERMRGEP